MKATAAVPNLSRVRQQSAPIPSHSPLHIDTYTTVAANPPLSPNTILGRLCFPYYTAHASLALHCVPSVQDVHQGLLMDCWAMAAIASVAHHNKAWLQSMMRKNDDDTISVLLYPHQSETPTQPAVITVRNEYPVTFWGDWLYAAGGWPAAFEKAIAVLNSRVHDFGNRQAQGYAAIDFSHYPSDAFRWIFGPMTKLGGRPIRSGQDLLELANAVGGGVHGVLCSDPAMSLSGKTAHAFALLGVKNGLIEVYDPYGFNSLGLPQAPGTREASGGILRLRPDDAARYFHYINVCVEPAGTVELLASRFAVASAANTLTRQGKAPAQPLLAKLAGAFFHWLAWTRTRVTTAMSVQ